MKRTLIILIAGVLLGALGGTAAYLHRTAPQRAMLCCKNPELAWLQHEFQMTDAQFARVQELDAGYQANCAEMCRRIGATNDLAKLEFTMHATVTPAMQHMLASAAQLRAECQAHMLEYCQAVSREMPADQGKRYLQWVSDQVLNMSAAMPAMQNPNSSGHGN
jgi:hypothetical protein